jgi:uncharacterized membrane protein ArfB
MDFVIQWLQYLVAFVAGSAVAWGIATASIKRRSEEEDTAEVLESHETGAPG